jgi:hypothetical protein
MSPADAMDATLARLQAGIRQSRAAVNRVTETPAHRTQRLQQFGQQRGGFTPRPVSPAEVRLEAARRATILRPNPYAPPAPGTQRDREEIDRQAEGVQIGDESRGRPTWDFPLLRRNDDWRRLRQDRREFEDLLHPVKAAAGGFGFPPRRRGTFYSSHIVPEFFPAPPRSAPPPPRGRHGSLGIAGVKAARQPVDPVDAAMARMRDAVARSGAAVRASRESAAHRQQRLGQFGQSRLGVGDPRLRAPNPPRIPRGWDQPAVLSPEQRREAIDHLAGAIATHDEEHERNYHDWQMLRRDDLDTYRWHRRDAQDWEDYLHPPAR